MYRAKLSQLFTLFFNEIGIRNSWIWRLNVCEKSESHEKPQMYCFVGRDDDSQKRADHAVRRRKVCLKRETGEQMLENQFL